MITLMKTPVCHVSTPPLTRATVEIGEGDELDIGADVEELTISVEAAANT